MAVAAGERQQYVGLEGAQAAKLWLESTTRFRAPFIAWGPAQMLDHLVVPQVHRTPRGFDLRGEHFDEVMQTKAEFFAEVKNYSAQHDQRTMYRDFLVTAYSACRYWQVGGEPKRPEFLWITWHPFGATDDFPKLTTVEWIKDACERDDEFDMAEHWDDDLGADLAKRIWLLIVPARMPEMRMSRSFLGLLQQHVTSNSGGA
jgi:hypothetical protein